MRLNGRAVRAAREARKSYLSQTEVSVKMRNLGWKGTTPTWVSCVERDTPEKGRPMEVTEEQATALAACLGVGLSLLLRPEDSTRLLLLRLEDELGRFGSQLDELRRTMTDPLLGMAAR